MIEAISGVGRAIEEGGGVVHATIPGDTTALHTSVARSVVVDRPRVDATRGGDGCCREVGDVLVDGCGSRGGITGQDCIVGRIVHVVGVKRAFHPPSDVVCLIGIVGAGRQSHGARGEEMDGIHRAAVAGDHKVLQWAIVYTVVYGNRVSGVVSISSVTRITDCHLDRNRGRGTAIIRHRSHKLDRREVDGEDGHLVSTHTGRGRITWASKHIDCNLGDRSTHISEQVAERTQVANRTVGEDRIARDRTLVARHRVAPTVQVEIADTRHLVQHTTL